MSITQIIGAIIQLIGLVLFKYYGWLVIVAIFAFLIYQNKRKTHWINEVDTVLLRVVVPKDNEKKELSAEQMFASLHGILRPQSELTKEGIIQEHVSFEIVAHKNTIEFYVWCPVHLKDFVESQIYAQYPTVQIKEGADDYTARETGERVIYGTDLHLVQNDMIPVKTFTSFEVDPLAGITGVLAKLNDPSEEIWIQILARPVHDSWHAAGKAYVDRLKAGKSNSGIMDILLDLPTYIVKNFIGALFSPPSANANMKSGPAKAELSTGQQTVIKAVEEKINKLGYAVKIRIVYRGPDPALARQRMQAIVGGFKQFNTTNLNGFTNTKFYDSETFLDDYRARYFHDKGFIFNIEELASLYHLPHKSVETPNMVWTTSKTSEPPANLPVEGLVPSGEVSLFGQTNFRGRADKFGIKRRDRNRHLYIVGQTGTGKSFLLLLLTLSDIYHDQGFCIIDPHGDFATDAMKYIPEHRLKDVVYFNAADRDFPMAFNPMEVSPNTPRDHVSSELVGVLKRMFENSWGPRLEYILRYAILALLENPGSTMLDITRMLTDKAFRNHVVKNVQDSVVKNFWTTEFASWDAKFASEAVAPILNKVGAFVANPLVRNIIGQQKSAFDVRQIMDEGKILIVNLSKGRVGEDNAAYLGSLMVTKVQLAAMSRADIPNLDDRRPFYLYVDEFQNFATDSFGVILSEARKYNLILTVANQYTTQMIETVRDAVFGNVGSMITFRVGPSDSAIMAKYFEPAFAAQDITLLNNQHIMCSLIVNGEKAIPFSATTLHMPKPENDLTEQIVAFSRQHIATPKDDAERDIESRLGGAGGAGDKATQGSTNASQHSNNPSSYVGSAAESHRPRSEFLAALKNPDLPAPSDYGQKPNNNRGRDRGKSGDYRSAGDRPDRARGGERRGEGGQRRVDPPSRGATGQDDAVRRAIASLNNRSQDR